MKHHRFWAWGAVICMVMTFITGETSVIIPGSIIPTEYTSGFGFFYSSNSRDSYGKKSADGKTFSWYYNYTPSDAATVQLNLSQVVYHYYAIV